MKTVRFFVQTTIKLQRKYLGAPDCKYMENIVIDFISIKVTQMSPVHIANLVANSGNTAYGVDVIKTHYNAIYSKYHWGTPTLLKQFFKRYHKQWPTSMSYIIYNLKLNGYDPPFEVY